VLTTFPLLKRDFIDSGKVRWVVRDMPLAFHGNARKAAQAAHCAADQHKFWEMREILFSNNAKLGLDDLPGYAQQIGLDTGAFGDCLASDRHVAQIEQESQEATRLGMRGTPSFVVGKSTGDTVTGRLVIGAQPAAVFTAEIKRALAQAAAGKKAPERKPAAGRTPEKKPAAG
jgi:protein-disulfide isomerase